MRYRPVDQVIDELELLRKDYEIDSFYVLDDCFMINKERTIEFCQKMMASNVNMIWGAETRANLVRKKDEDVLRLMKKAGLVQLDFGVESGSPAMLREIKKAITVSQTREAFGLCRNKGIRTYANIMYNLPHETEDDVKMTNQLIDEIRPM